MPESVARQRLREAREKAAAEWEAAEVPRPKPSPAGGPSMFRTAVEAAAGVLPDASTATVEQVALAVLRVALPLHETQHAAAWKAAHERAVHFEWEAVKAAERAEKAEAELDRVRSQLGEPETQWGHQVHADDGWRGDEVPQTDEQAARLAVAHMNKQMPQDARAVLIQREVRVHEGPWRVVPACECPHTDQPDGRLVRDGVLALGCPVHDPDAGGCEDAP